MIVDPEVPGTPSYIMPITSGMGSCQNVPSCSDEENTGPIPPGDYTANTQELTNPGIIGDIGRNTLGDWGDWRIPIVPLPGTNTYGRGGFFLHGGMFPGSAGCVDFGGGIFGNNATNQLQNSLLLDPDGIIPITVF
ncbi:MAG: tlde1 domain-containing protein [Candidatus Thiodiazotropha sp.]